MRNIYKTFGELIRQKRIELKMTLRGFCEKTGYDVAYISRLENGLMLASADAIKLQKLARSLNISEKTKEWGQFFDLAAISRKTLPKDIDAKLLNYLPAFLRTATKKELKKRDVEKLLMLIKEGKGE